MINITNKKFGRLTAIKIVGKHPTNGELRWLFKCDCGQTIKILGSQVSSGHSQSCGCFQKEQLSKRMTTHGFGHSRFYRIWCNIFNRQYKKDVLVCRRWQKFENFRDDMYQTYLDHVSKFGESDTSIDRIDNNGKYTPLNCQWATRKIQCRNRTKKVFVNYNGESHRLIDLCEQKELSYPLVHNRIRRGWTIERSIDTPLTRQHF